jgi:POT family proton-dependent oligopeptide transporter
MEKIDNIDSVVRDATPQEILELLHEPSDIPVTAWLLAFTGAAAQLARYGITVVWRKLRLLFERAPTY